MTSGLAALQRAYERCASFADRIAARGDMAEHVSEFWAEILGDLVQSQDLTTCDTLSGKPLDNKFLS